MRRDLSAKELRILTLISSGKVNKQISKECNVSVNTVKTHVARICHTLGATDGAHAVGMGHVNRLLDDTVYTFPFPLSKEEEQLIRCIANGKSVTEVALSLKVARETIFRRLGALYAKTGAVNQANLVHLAFRARVIRRVYPRVPVSPR